MTRQTAAPLTRLPINTFNRRADDLAAQVVSGDVDVNPPYQRGEVWTTDQQVGLVFSLLTGLPIPTIIVNRRWGDGPSLVVIDGKQRLTAIVAWFNGELAVPASWFPSGEVASVTETADGPYVTLAGLTDHGRARASRSVLPVGETEVATVEEEATIYLIVNGAGTPQSDADMANAARIANPS